MNILIMIDMQKDFISGALKNDDAKAIVPAVAERIKAYLKEGKAPLYYTMDTHYSDYMDTLEGKNLPIPHCINGTEGWQLADEIQEVMKPFLDESKIMFKKNTFGSLNLANHIKNMEQNIDSIEIIGVCTDICVISNAMLLRAALPNVKISVNAKCCAGISKEAHLNALAAMKQCQIDILED